MRNRGNALLEAGQQGGCVDGYGGVHEEGDHHNGVDDGGNGQRRNTIEAPTREEPGWWSKTAVSSVAYGATSKWREQLARGERPQPESVDITSDNEGPRCNILIQFPLSWDRRHTGVASRMKFSPYVQIT